MSFLSDFLSNFQTTNTNANSNEIISIDLHQSGTNNSNLENNEIRISAPSNVEKSYSLTLPSTIGNINQVLTLSSKNGNNGVLTFSDQTGSGESGSSSFLGLTDTPSSYNTHQSKFVKVNSAGNH